MNVNSSCFRLSGALIAAAMFAAASCALAQATGDGAPEARAPEASANTPPPEKRREHGRRHNDASKKTETTAAATEPTAAPFPSQPSAKAGSSDVICKYDTLSGTKMKRKICGTPEQWAAWRRKNEENVEETTRKTRQAAGSVPRPDVTQRQMPTGGQ